jgi:hypothetical protein
VSVRRDQSGRSSRWIHLKVSESERPSIIELEVLHSTGIRTVTRCRTEGTVENRDQKQVVLIQSHAARRSYRIITCFNGLKIDRVTVREPTLEDAYIRLVEGKVVESKV